jgi:hypothetical protein
MDNDLKQKFMNAIKQEIYIVIFQRNIYIEISRCVSYTNFWIYSDKIITEKHITINEGVYDF